MSPAINLSNLSRAHDVGFTPFSSHILRSCIKDMASRSLWDCEINRHIIRNTSSYGTSSYLTLFHVIKMYLHSTSEPSQRMYNQVGRCASYAYLLILQSHENLEDMSVTQLRKICEQKGVTATSWDRNKLLKLIAGAAVKTAANSCWILRSLAHSTFTSL